MERVKLEEFWLIYPDFKDVFVRGESFEGLQPAAKIVGIDKVIEVALELLVAVIVIAFDSCLLDGPVHPLDLTIGPGVFDLGQPVLDAVFLTAHIEHVGHISGRWTVGIA